MNDPSGSAQSDHRPPIIGAILRAVHRRTGVDFSVCRPSFVERRILNRMAVIGVPTLQEYLLLVEGSETESHALVSRLTIKVSRFYRNARTFDVLRRQVLPALARVARTEPLRVWCAGCGCGEEAYTLAILLEELGASASVVATDVDSTALETARAGRYGLDALSELPDDLRARYTVPLPDGRSFTVHGCVQRRVRFVAHDLTGAAPIPGAAFHLVSCRNVLIYLRREFQERVFGLLLSTMALGGYLCLGEAEWPPSSRQSALDPVERNSRVFRVPAAIGAPEILA
jgi:chemotaxis methyl-accepting protein methylase